MVVRMTIDQDAETVRQVAENARMTTEERNTFNAALDRILARITELEKSTPALYGQYRARITELEEGLRRIADHPSLARDTALGLLGDAEHDRRVRTFKGTPGD